MVQRLFDALYAGVAEPLALVTDPTKRVFWPFLLISAAIAFAVLAIRSRSWRRAGRELLSRDVWLHRSALMDYRLVPVKMFVYTLLLAPLILSAWGLAVGVASWLDASFGAAGATSLSRTEITVVYTVVLFVAWDASRYVVHRLLHQVPALWEFHKVHHSAEVLTPATVHRVHPVESLLFGLRGALVTGLVTGVFFYLFADAAVQYQLLGVNVVGLTFNAVVANLRHSHIWLSFGPWLERFLISPAQHQLHHSTDPADFNCNFGSHLALWDRLGGSLRLAGEQRRLQFGLDADDCNHDPASVWSAIVSPFAGFARAARTRLPRYVLVATVIIVSCSDDAPGAPDAKIIDFDYRALLTNVGENVIMPAADDFETESGALAGAIGDYCTALGTAGEADALTAAQTAWRSTIASWQRATLMLVGPAAANSHALSDVIYSWPIVSACAVDQDVMLLRNDPGNYDVTTKLTNRRGLDALEYLLFTTSLDSVCPATAVPAGWDALTDADKRAARCAFAEVAAGDVASHAAELADAWRPSGGNFIAELTTAGNGSTTYPGLLDAVNDVFAALFYIDLTTKDLKLAEPLGLMTNICAVTNQACPEERESVWANESKSHISGNLAGLEAMYTGGDGVGFDDLVIAAGGADVNTAMNTAIANANSSVDNLSGSLNDELGSNYAGVTTVHTNVKAITDLLKTDIPNLTGLRVPPESGGDAD